jgi:hypothetical protein
MYTGTCPCVYPACRVATHTGIFHGCAKREVELGSSSHKAHPGRCGNYEWGEEEKNQKKVVLVEVMVGGGDDNEASKNIITVSLCIRGSSTGAVVGKIPQSEHALKGVEP